MNTPKREVVADALPELLPCPFCGGDAEMLGNSTQTIIRCPNDQCIIYTGTPLPFNDYGHKAAAIEAWNNRPAPLATPTPEASAGVERLRVDRDWSEYPIGTKAHAVMGGYWIRVQHGWKWFNGSTFPTPGGDACGACIELPATATAEALTSQTAPSSAGVEERDYDMEDRGAAALYAHCRPDAEVKWEDLNDYEADKFRDEAQAVIAALRTPSALRSSVGGEVVGWKVTRSQLAEDGFCIDGDGTSTLIQRNNNLYGFFAAYLASPAQPELSMSMFANRDDYNAAIAEK